MRKWRNCTTTSFKRWFRLPRWPRCDPSGFDVYLDQRTSELTILSQVQTVYIGTKVEGHFRYQFGCRFVFPHGHLVIVLLQADCGFWVCAVVVGSAGHEIDLAGSEGWEGMEVDIIKPQVDRFVFSVGHAVIVPAGRPSSKFGLRHWPSVLRDVVFLHGPGSGAVCLLRNLTRTKAYKIDFQLLPKEIDAKVAKIACSSTQVRTFGDLWYEPHFELDVQQFFVIEGSCRSRLALELDGQQFFAVEGSCRRKISKWKSRAQVVRELPQVPQGTTASTTPPFVRAGYDCRNNTTVLRRPEAAGWAPLV